MPSEPAQLLLVFADDWGRHPSSCQHLMRCLLPRHSVYWVNTIGTRTPRLDLASVRRGAEKFRQWRCRPGAAPAFPHNLHVLNPKMWPSFATALSRRLNRQLLVRQLSAILERLPAAPIAVTTVPIVADLMGDLDVAHWAYYCVDDFSQWPGLDQNTLRHFEERLVRRADVLIAASEPLQQRLAEMGRESHLLTHGIDLDFWASPEGACECPQLNGLQRPLVVFWGLIDRRMDVAFVRQLAAEMTGGTIVLVGPEADPDRALYACERVVRIESLPIERLPHVAAHACVLIMPYADISVTRAAQPLKLKEYLATGKPVVARALPSTRAWADCLDLANTPEEFALAVRLRLAQGLPDQQRAARRRLESETWSEKAQQFERWIVSDTPSKNPTHHSTAAGECIAR